MRYERSDAQEQLLLSYVLATAVVAEEGILDRDAFEGLRAALQVGRRRDVGEGGKGGGRGAAQCGVGGQGARHMCVCVGGGQPCGGLRSALQVGKDRQAVVLVCLGKARGAVLPYYSLFGKPWGISAAAQRASGGQETRRWRADGIGVWKGKEGASRVWGCAARGRWARTGRGWFGCVWEGRGGECCRTPPSLGGHGGI